MALAVATEVTATRAPSALQWALFAALLCAAMIPFLRKAARPLRTYAGMLVLLTLLAVFFWNALPTWMSEQASGVAVLNGRMAHTLRAGSVLALLTAIGWMPLLLDWRKRHMVR